MQKGATAARRRSNLCNTLLQNRQGFRRKGLNPESACCSVEEIDGATEMRFIVTPMSRILIADDQPDVLEALRILLKGEGYQTDAVTSLGAVMNSLEKRTYSLLMMDLNYTRDTTSGKEGLEVIPRI